MINFRSKFHPALLGYYFENPNQEHYVRELSRTLSFNAAYVSRELKALTGSGIFLVSTRNHQKYFRLNRKHPLINEIKKIVNYIVDKKATSSVRLKNYII